MKVRLTQFLRRAVHASVLSAAIVVTANPLTLLGEDNPRVTPIVEAIRKTESAVVNIQGNKTVSNTSASGVSTRQEVNGMGTGVIIDRRGLIITNYHVVDSVEKIEVTLADGTTTIAKLINYDPETDLAMIKINVDWELPTINVGRSDDLMRGESVIAIGNPFGYQNTVTVGIISALHRNIPVNGSQQYTDLIQTNADINPGNSGGPLLNTNGEVIGINVAVRVGAQGIGFAIPIDNALDVMANLVAQYRKSGSHGLLCQRVPS
ncbi:MAG: trypsin-like peptidase domain-containing protein, partial [Pirellula sp.]|nr:trypsin-like peptidase domain-containing protein [Pirellula sp.]